MASLRWNTILFLRYACVNTHEYPSFFVLMLIELQSDIASGLRVAPTVGYNFPSCLSCARGRSTHARTHVSPSARLRCPVGPYGPSKGLDSVSPTQRRSFMSAHGTEGRRADECEWVSIVPSIDLFGFVATDDVNSIAGEEHEKQQKTLGR